MILVINAGSSSLKIELFDEDLRSRIAGSVSEIGNSGILRIGRDEQNVSAATHQAALAQLLLSLTARGFPVATLTAAAHRVVHGGANLTAPARVTDDLLERIEACVPLAPLHNPNNLAGIRAMAQTRPELPQFVSFDTAFHATNRPVATTYAIPEDLRKAGIRRYGFHGLSYASIVEYFGDNLPQRLLAFHLGNGASLCAIRSGQSVATSMGYSPLDGLVMGTRAGSIDGMAVLRMAELHGIDQAADILNRQSGLRALGGTNDMATLLESGSAEAAFAVDHFCHWAARQAGAAIVAMGGVDAVAFTGGIGENAKSIRDLIMTHLSCFGELEAHVVPADEEKQIARDALGLIAEGR